MTKKFLVSIMAIALTAIALGASTFAWFTLQKVNTVGQISMTVTGDVGLEISLDGKTWKNELTSPDIEAWMAANASSLVLSDTTSANGVLIQKREISAGTLSNASENVDYLKITFYFRALTNEPSIYLVDEQTETTLGQFYTTAPTNGGTWISSKGVSWKPDVSFENAEGDVIDTGTAASNYYASQALRLSFYNHTISADAFTVANGVTAVSVPATGATATIFDLSKDPTRGYGFAYGAKSYFEAKTGTTITLPTTTPTTINELTTVDDSYTVNNNNSLVSTLVAQTEKNGNQQIYIGAATMFMWLEGWDGDCFDSIFKDQIKVQLQFKQAKAYSA